MISRGSLSTRLLCGAAMLSAAIGGAAYAETARYNIPPQSLDTALKDFGLQSGHTILFNDTLTGSKKSQGLFLSTEPETALKTLLQGTGLSYRRDRDVFVITTARYDASPRQPVSATIAPETVSGSAVEGLVVTAQKRREQIQDVPIAISAFSADALQAQKIEGGFDLLKAIPNVTFSKNNFTSYNFSIRGVGTKAISATTDPGVAVSFNNVSLLQNRLFEQEYFDIERVEVLRGPQGTLYGRNATSGVVNLITEKADSGEFDGWLKGEIGNYDTKRLSAMINIPLIEDVLALRVAGSMTERQGYDFNATTDHNINGRDLWSGRLSIAFDPVERIHADFIWERFKEDDDRSRTGKQLCKRDPGPTQVGNYAISHDDSFLGQMRPALFSQGCLPVNLYDDAAFGTPNGLALPFVFGALFLGGGGAGFPIGADPNTGLWKTILEVRDPYAGRTQSRDLRVIESIRDPVYRAQADVLQLNIDIDVTDSLTFTSQTVYNKDETYSFQDFNRFNTQPVFTDTSNLDADPWWGEPSLFRQLAPGGVFCDPQLGCSDSIVGFDIAKAKGEQFGQEFRLQSNFDGPVNFSVGANYTRFSTLVDYYVFYNLITALAQMPPLFTAPADGWDTSTCGLIVEGGFVTVSPRVPTGSTLNAHCPYIDPNPIDSINGEGHNYFRSKNPYKLESSAAFGEVYWEATDALKVTAGLRYTDDNKTFTPLPTQVLLAPGVIAGGTVNRGYPALPDIEQHWGEFTGRIGVDWKPDLAFTDDTMLYAFYSRGYKGGGANPPLPGYATTEETAEQMGFTPEWVALYEMFGALPTLRLTGSEYSKTFKPEFVDAFEVGAKNTLLDGALMFNTSAFYYDYKDYQVSQIRDRSAVNENFDAKIWGLEFETLFAPTENLRINANLGYLDTKIAKGSKSIDIMDRTNSNPNYVIIKPWFQQTANCVVPVPVVERWLQNPSGGGLGGYMKFCGGGGTVGGFSFPPIDPNPDINGGTGAYDPANYPELNGGSGLWDDIGGNELPNSPHWTMNIGAQYSWDLFGAEWEATVRADAYWQSQSWARVYNSDPYDKLHGWYNTNMSFWIEKPEADLKIEFYVKNILDDTPITDTFLNSDDTALTTNIFTLDPRLIGVQITKGF